MIRPIRTCQWVDEDGACDNMVEGNTDYCGSHNHAIRDADRKALKEKKVYKIPKQSKKRVKESREYSVLAKQQLEEHPHCQVPGCGLKATQCHHKKGRAGKLYLDKTKFLSMCDDHHDYYTEHSKEAIELGISLLRSVPENKTI